MIQNKADVRTLEKEDSMRNRSSIVILDDLAAGEAFRVDGTEYVCLAPQKNHGHNAVERNTGKGVILPDTLIVERIPTDPVTVAVLDYLTKHHDHLREDPKFVGPPARAGIAMFGVRSATFVVVWTGEKAYSGWRWEGVGLPPADLRLDQSELHQLAAA